jgi:hypothetical protein
MAQVGRPYDAPDRRYWRRRANRHVRKVRLNRTLLRWSGIVLVNLAVAAAILYAGARAMERLSTTTEFQLRVVEIEGVSRASTAELRVRLERLVGMNLLEVDLPGVATWVREDPWVREAAVKRILPGTLRVTVTEREPTALAVLRGLVHLVDDTGFVIGVPGHGAVENLPVLTGLDGYEGEALSRALFRGVRAVQVLRASTGPWADRLSEVDLSLPDRIAVTPMEPGPRLLLDPDRVERNVGAWLALRAEIDRRVGPLDYADLRWSDRISVLPATARASGAR